MSKNELIMKASDGGSFGGYLAKPKSGKGPGLLVLQEIFGVNQVMRDICDHFAAEGYFALCPDLFWRQEPGIQLTDKSTEDWARAFELFKGFDLDKGIADLEVALETLRQQQGVAGRVGCVGYCLGGRLAYLMAARSKIDASVGYYGVALQDHLDEAKNIRHPLLLHVASSDKFTPEAARDKIIAALKGHPRINLNVYAGMEHAFARVGGEHYDKINADLANQRTTDFLRANLS